MKRAGASDATIRQELRYHGVDHKLSADELVDIKEAGAGDALLSAAVSTPVREARGTPSPSYYRHANDYDDLLTIAMRPCRSTSRPR